ncbi:lipoate--protein ligase family protein [Nodosilinea sp. LEGE 07088]|nr:lipoate--protein ligase family protein [Nodosilinea sp. LEGE 07088]
MAIDTWLLDQHQHHGHPPALRFYTWTPAAISLGVSQRRQVPTHWHQLTWQGSPVELVQRPTGGRGVLHQGDLTYSLVTSHLEGSRDQVYRTLCQFLIEGWGQLGVPLDFGQPSRAYLRSQSVPFRELHNCFALATSADLVDANGHKVIGSAQLRRGPYLLQHGSMGLSPDADLWQQVFQTVAPPLTQAQTLVRAGLTTASVVDALIQAAARCLGCQFLVQPLTQQEWQAIQDLALPPSTASTLTGGQLSY